jgi:hypothetical protein
MKTLESWNDEKINYFTGTIKMKICAISPFTSATRTEILNFISRCDHDLIVLPGYAENHPTPQSLAEVLKKGMFAFVETRGGKVKSIPCLVSSTQQIIRMPKQCVFEGEPRAKDLDDLQRIWHQRTHEIGNREFSFAICGEINEFNINGSVKMKRELPYDILVNPAHSIMGHWNHLGVKLTRLSIGTIVIHVANNDHNHHRITTDVRIYVDGQVMERQVSGNIAWSECEI